MVYYKIVSFYIASVVLPSCILGAGLMIETLVQAEKCGTETKQGKWLTVHYKGTLASDGSQFDSSYDRDEPFEFLLGNGEVIKGWDQGLIGMCVGEKRKLTVPPELGYGSKGAGDVIPGGATLIFEIELISVQDPPKANNIFKDIDKDGDNLLSQDEVSNFIRQQETDHNLDMMDDSAHNAMVVDIFEAEDKDRDGLISREEFGGPKRQHNEEL